MPLATRPSSLSILSKFVRFMHLYRRRARAASWVVYEVRALHGTSPHPARLRGSPAGLFCPSAPPFVCSFVSSLPDARAVPSNPESGCRVASGGCPSVSGHSPKKTSSMFTNLVAFPSGFWVRAPLGLIVVQHGRGIRSAPSDESTCGGASRTRNFTESQLDSFCYVVAPSWFLD